VDAFLDEAPRRLAELRQAAAQGDVALARRSAHTLKSNGLTFGADEFAALCRRLEAAAGEGGLAEHRELIDRLDEEWTHVRDELAVVRGGGAG
jgi:HPt (histidine-containing phosphotransfer) domain-containing protein